MLLVYITEDDSIFNKATVCHIEQLELYDAVVKQAELEILGLASLEDFFDFIVLMSVMNEPEVNSLC